jgi:tRNA threonylcarbamoyladenosine biosynthesis protein TsaB
MLLAIDTATRTISLALYDGGAVLAEATWQTANYHTVELTPAIESMLERAGVAPGDLQAIAVALGPGSYTGLRIGLGVAKGLILAVRGEMALVGIPTLDIVAASQPPLAERLCALAQAGRGRVSAGFYVWGDEAWRAEGQPFITDWPNLVEQIEAPTLVCGELTPEGREALASLGERVILPGISDCLRRAGYLAELAWKRFTRGEIDDPVTLAPMYLREP